MSGAIFYALFFLALYILISPFKSDFEFYVKGGIVFE